MNSLFRSKKQIQRKIIVASQTLKNTYDTSLSGTPKPIIIYNINDTLPYLADFDVEKNVLKITADDFLGINLQSNDIRIFFITNATQDNIDKIMGKIQDRDKNISECFVIVEKEEKLAQVQQHQQYVQEPSLSENTRSFDTLESISYNLEKLPPKTLDEFEQGLKSPNNYFLISKGLPQHIRKFYKDIYQIKNCTIVKDFFDGKVENVFAGKITHGNSGIVKSIDVEVGKDLEIENGTDQKYYIIPLCDITVYETNKPAPQIFFTDITNIKKLKESFQYWQNEIPSIISKVIMTTGGQDTCAAGTDFLDYLEGYQLCFNGSYIGKLTEFLQIGIINLLQFMKNLENLSIASVIIKEITKEFPPIFKKTSDEEYNLKKQLYIFDDDEDDDDDENDDDDCARPTFIQRDLNPTERSRIKSAFERNAKRFKNLGVNAKRKIDALHAIFNSYDDPSKKLLQDKISYAKILEYEYNAQEQNRQK